MDISKYSLEQLKALAFDLIGQKENIQQNLNLVLQQIDKKQAEPKAAAAEPKKEKK